MHPLLALSLWIIGGALTGWSIFENSDHNPNMGWAFIGFTFLTILLGAFLRLIWWKISGPNI